MRVGAQGPGEHHRTKPRRYPRCLPGLVFASVGSPKLVHGNSMLVDLRRPAGLGGASCSPCESSRLSPLLERGWSGTGRGRQRFFVGTKASLTIGRLPVSSLSPPCSERRPRGTVPLAVGRWGCDSRWVWGRRACRRLPRLTQEGPGALPCPLLVQLPAASPGWAQGLMCVHAGPAARVEMGQCRGWDLRHVCDRRQGEPRVV